MDYRLKALYEQMLNGDNGDNNKQTVSSRSSLSNLYEEVKEGVKQETAKNSVPADDNQKLKLITGITNDVVIHQLYEIYNYFAENGMFESSDVAISVGSPKEGTYDPEAILTYVELKNIVSLVINNTRKNLIITHSTDTRKLRTPYGVRIGAWKAIQDSDVTQCYNALNTPNPKTLDNILKKLRCLIIFHLYKTYPTNINFTAKVAPGIGPELAQVDSFNESLKGMPPVSLIIPGDKEPVPDVLFNGAAKIKGTGKADIALLNESKEVFWISFKEGSHVPTSRADKATLGFQQWGSLKKLYETDTSIKWAVDLFLTKCVSQYKDNFITFDIPSNTLTQDRTLYDEIEETLKQQSIKNISEIFKKEIPNASRIHIVKEATSMFFRLFEGGMVEKQNKLQETMNLALKAIYGEKFQYNTNVPFGRENVNLILETPNPLKFNVLTNPEGDPQAMELVMIEGSHVIKNPDLPDSDPYLPCLYMRRSTEDRFLYYNKDTQQSELIVGGRVLVYPVSKAEGGDEVVYSPASFKK